MSKAKASKAYIILRIVAIVFAILCPIAMISSAVAITLYEGAWWFNYACPVEDYIKQFSLNPELL